MDGISDLFLPTTPLPYAYMITRTQYARCDIRHLREPGHLGGGVGIRLYNVKASLWWAVDQHWYGWSEDRPIRSICSSVLSLISWRQNRHGCWAPCQALHKNQQWTFDPPMRIHLWEGRQSCQHCLRNWIKAIRRRADLNIPWGVSVQDVILVVFDNLLGH